MYYQLLLLAQYVFGLSLVLLMISLYISFREIQMSVQDLKMELLILKSEIDKAARKNNIY